MTAREPSERDKSNAAAYYNEHKDFHDSDGVDAAECFLAGVASQAPIIEMLIQFYEYPTLPQVLAKLKEMRG